MYHILVCFLNVTANIGYILTWYCICRCSCSRVLSNICWVFKERNQCKSISDCIT